MVKVNIERRTVDVPAPYLPAGTFFQYKNETRESSHGFLLKVDRALYTLYDSLRGQGYFPIVTPKKNGIRFTYTSER